MRDKIKEELSFLEDDECVLCASKIQGDWFPQIEADIFISHSHQDEKLAISFAGWLYENFNLTSFIDSCVWGYCDDLLKKIDNKYCINPHNNTYNYNKRNISTSIVHLMLMNALTKMIDNTECLFFIDTDNSIPLKDGIQKQTYSPWIFGEIEISRTIRRIKPNRISSTKICDTKCFSEINESVKASFPLNMEHLINVDVTELNNWREMIDTTSNKKEALDYLYKRKKIIL